MDRTRIAARHWEHLTPIALGDVPELADFELERRDITPDLWAERELGAAETSFSKYVQARVAGDDSVIALPIFVMRAFRHRCIITRKESRLTSAEELKGKRIGLTGWGDSGNTWTRAILREAGVGIADAEWRVGALTADHPVMDRIGSITVPRTVAPTENDEPMMEMLDRGALDAVMTPFMPPGFYRAESRFRTLFSNPQEVEAKYYARTGYVPGIHLLAVQASIADNREQLQAVMDGFAAAKQLSTARRTKLLDVTPWQNEAVAATHRVFNQDWMPYGWSSNATMINGFLTELIQQGVIASRPDLDELFPHQLEPSASLEKVTS